MIVLTKPSFDNVKNWILKSGLILLDKNDENFGGVYSFYDEKKSSFSFLYPEITGYAISTMRFLYEKEQKQEYLEIAKSSSNWLLKIFENFGGIVQGIGNDPSKTKLTYSFDMGICAKGFLDIFELSHEHKYLNFAKTLLDLISNEALQNDGTILPFKNLNENEFSEKNDVWYNKRGNLHIKTSMPFFQFASIENNKQFTDIGIKICDSYIQYEHKNFLALHADSDQVNLHTFCYALEGLLYAYFMTKNEKYLDCCYRYADWCVSKINDDGSIPLWFNSKFVSRATYPVAQLSRILILLSKLNNNYLPYVKKLQFFLSTMQSTSNNTKLNGGMYEEFYKSFFSWKKRLRLNSWTSMFSLQAIYWYENFEKIDFDETKLIY